MNWVKNLIKEATGSTESLEALLQEFRSTFTYEPRLILLDLNIPEISGREILQTLRKDSAFDNVKVIVMSGVERGGDAEQEVRRLGADDFLNKSFKPRELLNRVRTTLEL
jgi:DNA-binding response OmpR family regulator